MRKLIRGEEGAGLVSVLLISAMLLTLGATCVFASYVNAMMKETDRGTRKNFYALEETVDGRRGVILTCVSKAIETAYGQKLFHLADDPGFTFSDYFIDALIAELEAAQILVDENGVPLGSIRFEDIFEWADDAKTRLRFIHGIGFDTLTVGATAGDVGFGHNYTNILTGFVITVPTFATVKDGDLTHLKDFTLIAGGQVSNSGHAAVVGNMYADRFLAEGGGSLGLLGAGDGVLPMDGRVSAMPYNIYVGDDLELQGSALSGAAVTVNGAYIGMGDSASDAEKSSAILVNGAGRNSLDISGVTNMTLAGRGFIWYFADSVIKNVIPMGNTITVQADQVAYLVPDSRSANNCFDAADYLNPHLAGGTDNAPNDTKLSAIGANGSFTRMEPLGDGNTLVYYFLDFADDAARRAYFNKYFAENGADYFDAYLDSYQFTAGTARSAGLAWVSDAPALGGANYGGEPARLAKLRVTLDDAAPGTLGADNPYGFYVLKEAAGMEFEAAGATPAKAKFISADPVNTIDLSSYGDYTVLVLTGGDAQVSGEFSGLIIAMGNVTLVNAKLNPPDPAALEALYTAGKNASGELLETYLRFYWRNGGGGGSVNWDLDQMGNYSRWIKNED